MKYWLDLTFDMMKYLYFLTFAAIVLLLISCKDDAEHDLVDKYPQLATGRISGLDSSGVNFVGLLDHLGKYPIVDHGFIWGMAESYKPDIRKLSLGKLETEGDFTSRITGDIKSGTKYYAKAYIATSDFMVYGDTVSFIGQGSSAPMVERVVPPVISTYYGRLVIYGKNFCSNIYDAKLNHSNANIWSVSPDSIVVNVYRSSVGTNYLKISIFDQEISVPYQAEPIIVEHIKPQPVAIGSTASINGRHLSNIDYISIIDNAGHESSVSIIERNNTELLVKIPVVVEEGGLNLKLYDNVYYPKGSFIVPIEITSLWKWTHFPTKMPIGTYHMYQGNHYVFQENILYKVGVLNHSLSQIAVLPQRPSTSYSVLDFMIGSKMYFCIPNLQELFMSYDITTGIWEELNPATGDFHRGYRSFVIGGKAYVCFLENATGYYYLWSFDPQTRVWTKLQRIEDLGRWVSVVDDKAYFFLYQDVLIFDSSTHTFERKSLPYYGSGYGQAFTYNQKIYILENGTLKEYDPLSNQMKELPQTNHLINVMFSFDGKIYQIYDNGNKCMVASIPDLRSYP